MRFRKFLTGLLVAVAAAGSAAEALFTEEKGVIQNPGQGWSACGPYEKWAPYVNIGSGYTRTEWADLEPSEGVYTWKKLDRAIDAFAKRGLPFAFRIMCANRHSGKRYATPKWVFDKGAASQEFDGVEYTGADGVRTRRRVTPIFDDPVFMAAHERFIKALAARYDGDPRLLGLDLGSYGTWGEWHCYGLSLNSKKKMKKFPYEIRRQYADWYLENFHTTPIVFMTDDWEVLRYSLGTGTVARVGLRRDGVASPGHFKRWIGTPPYDAIPRMADVWKDQPVWFEWYDQLSAILKSGWDVSYSVAWMLTNHVSVVNTIPFNPISVSEHPAYEADVRKIDLYAGARFVPRAARLSRDGTSLKVSVSGVNKGVSRIYLPYEARYEFRTADGHVLAAASSVWDPTSVLPGPFMITDRITVPKNVPTNARLVLRLVHTHRIFRDFRFAAKELDKDGALILGIVRD